MAALFGSLPLASRILLGAWDFTGAADVAFLCLIVGVYFHLVGRRFSSLPDPAAMLDQANHLAASGRPDDALTHLTEAIRLSPQFWQAYQYRGELHLRRGSLLSAIQDFSQAISLAPREPQLYAWRGYARTLAGDSMGGQKDYDSADALAAGTPDAGPA